MRQADKTFAAIDNSKMLRGRSKGGDKSGFRKNS